MKKTTKIIVTVVVSIGIIAGVGGMVIKSKIDETKSIVSEAKNQTAKVEKGNLKVSVSGSGTVVSKDQSNDKLELQVEIDELDIDKVKVNQSVEIKLDAFPDEVFYGTVTEVAPQGTVVNGVSSYMIKVSLPDSIREVATIKSDTNLRQGQSDKYQSIQELDEGDIVEIIAKDGDYYKVATNDNKQGWVEKDYIADKKIKENQIGTINKDVVNLKSKTSSDSDTVIKLIKGNTVELIEKDGDWYKVKTNNGKEGYIKAEDLDTQKIKSGMNGSASILVQEKNDVLYIPIEAVNKEKVDDYYIISPKDSKEKGIKVGIHNEDYIEVTEGLNKGDEVKLPEKEVKLPQSPFEMTPPATSN